MQQYRQVGDIRDTYKGRKVWNPPETKSGLRAARFGIRAALALGSISHMAIADIGGMEVQQDLWIAPAATTKNTNKLNPTMRTKRADSFLSGAYVQTKHRKMF